MISDSRHHWAVRYPFVRLLFFFASGMVLAYHYPAPLWKGYMGLMGFFITYCMCVAWSPKGSLVGITGFLALFMSGYVGFLQEDPSWKGSHLLHMGEHIEGYEGVMVSEVMGKRWARHGLLLVKRVRVKGVWQSASGRVRLSGKTLAGCGYGDRLLIYGAPEVIRRGGNPFGVNEEKLFHTRHIYHTHDLKRRDFVVVGHETPSWLMSKALLLRAWAARRLKGCISHAEVEGVVLAMLLGIRGELSYDVRSLYNKGGVSHILAISGLHVGLLYWLLWWLFSLFGFFRRRTGYRYLGVLTVLGGYALVSGLSPSVLRAVGMVTLMGMGLWMKRRYTLLNGLCSIGFLLLLVNPYWLLDLSFQLSFSAVGAIAGLGAFL